MFAKSIIDSDMFLDMPATAQLLYFQLAIRADDDGFINNPKRIMRDVRCSDDDMKLLAAKKYVIPFESGVVVITHWRIHNYIRRDRYTATTCIEEKKMLNLGDNGMYELSGQPVVNHMTTSGQPPVNQRSTNGIPSGSIGKVRLGKDSLGQLKGQETKTVDVVDDMETNREKAIDAFQDSIHPIPNMFEMEKLNSMLDEFGPEWVFEAVKVAALQRARTIGYVSAVLDKWSKSGKNEPWIEDKPKEPVKEKPAGPTREQLEAIYKEKLYGQKS